MGKIKVYIVFLTEFGGFKASERIVKAFCDEMDAYNYCARMNQNSPYRKRNRFYEYRPIVLKLRGK